MVALLELGAGVVRIQSEMRSATVAVRSSLSKSGHQLSAVSEVGFQVILGYQRCPAVPEHWRDVLIPPLLHSFNNLASAFFTPRLGGRGQVFWNLAQDFSSLGFEQRRAQILDQRAPAFGTGQRSYFGCANPRRQLLGRLRFALFVMTLAEVGIFFALAACNVVHRPPFALWMPLRSSQPQAAGSI